MSELDWNDLRVVSAVAQAGSLSGAARALRVDHTTVARRLAAAEAALGLRLFDRLARGLRLTADGERCLPAIAEMAARADALQRAARETDPLAGPVRVSAPPVFASRYLAHRLAARLARRPGLDLELVGETAAVNLSAREADIAVRLMRPQAAGLKARRIGRMRFGLYAAPAYLAATAPADRRYAGYDITLDHVSQQQWVKAIAPGGRLALRSNDLATLGQWVAHGLAVAALPKFLAEAIGGLTELPTPLPAPARELWLALHPDLARSARVRLVAEAIAQSIDETL